LKQKELILVAAVPVFKGMFVIMVTLFHIRALPEATALLDKAPFFVLLGIIMHNILHMHLMTAFLAPQSFFAMKLV